MIELLLFVAAFLTAGGLFTTCGAFLDYKKSGYKNRFFRHSIIFFGGYTILCIGTTLSLLSMIL